MHTDVFLLKLSSQVTLFGGDQHKIACGITRRGTPYLDESCLACASIADYKVLGSIAEADTARGGEQITQDS